MTDDEAEDKEYGTSEHLAACPCRRPTLAINVVLISYVPRHQAVTTEASVAFNASTVPFLKPAPHEGVATRLGGYPSGNELELWARHSEQRKVRNRRGDVVFGEPDKVLGSQTVEVC